MSKHTHGISFELGFFSRKPRSEQSAEPRTTPPSNDSQRRSRTSRFKGGNGRHEAGSHLDPATVDGIYGHFRELEAAYETEIEDLKAAHRAEIEGLMGAREAEAFEYESELEEAEKIINHLKKKADEAIPNSMEYELKSRRAQKEVQRYKKRMEELRKEAEASEARAKNNAALAQKAVSLRKQLQDLQKELKAKEAEAENLSNTTKVTEIEKIYEVTNLRSELSEVKTELLNNQNSHEQTKADAAQFAELTTRVSQVTERLEAWIQTREKEITDNNQAAEEAKAEAEQYHLAFEAAKIAANTKLTAATEQFRRELEGERKLRAEAQAEIEKLRHKITEDAKAKTEGKTELVAKNEQLRSQLRDSQEEVNKLDRIAEAAEAERDNAMAKVHELEKRLTRAEDIHERTKAKAKEHTKLSIKIGQLRNQIKEFQESKRKAEDEAYGYRRAAAKEGLKGEKLEEEIIELKRKLAILETFLKQAEERAEEDRQIAAEKDRKITEICEKISKSEAQLTALKTLFGLKETEVKRHHQKANRAKEEAKSRSLKVEKLENELRQKNEELEANANEITELKKELAKLRESYRELSKRHNDRVMAYFKVLDFLHKEGYTLGGQAGVFHELAEALQCLRLEPGASPDQIKAAHKMWAMLLHGDRIPPALRKKMDLVGIEWDKILTSEIQGVNNALDVLREHFEDQAQIGESSLRCAS